MKKTIIMVHGIRGTHHGLGVIAKELSSQYKVITPDLPGSGTRMELKNKTIDGYSKWLHRYIKSLHLKEKPYIVGHSMGSMVVSYYVDHFPDDVQDEVVLMAPVFREKKNQANSNVSCTAFLTLLKIMPKSACYNFMRSKLLSYWISHYLTYDKSMQKQIDKMHYKYSGRFSSAESIMADIKISMRKQTTIPQNKKVLLIVGDKDKLTSLKLVHKKSQNNNIKLKIIPESGHLINYECPEIVAKHIAGYIK